MHRILLIVLLLFIFVSTYSLKIVVNTTNCSYYFPNITNNTTYYLLNGTYNSTECIQLNLTNKYNVTIEGQSRNGVYLYNLSTNNSSFMYSSIQVSNSKNINFDNVSFLGSANLHVIATNNSQVSINECNIYINATNNLIQMDWNNNITIQNSYLYAPFSVDVFFNDSNNTMVINNSTIIGRYIAEDMIPSNTYIYINNSNITYTLSCVILLRNVYISNVTITPYNNINDTIVIYSDNLSITHSLLKYINELIIYSFLYDSINYSTFIKNSTGPQLFHADLIYSKRTYFYNNKYYNNKNSLVFLGRLLYLYNNIFWFNISFNYISAFSLTKFPSITLAKNNTVNNNLSIETCGSNKKYYELIIDNCSSVNTTDYFVIVNQNSTYSYLNNSRVFFVIFGLSNKTNLYNDNFSFFFTRYNNVSVVDSSFRTIYANKVKVINSRTRLGNVSYYIYPLNPALPSFNLNNTSAIICSQIYANRYYNTLINNSFDIIKNNTTSYVYNSKLCVPSSFRILDKDKVYIYYSWINNFTLNYTTNASLIILTNRSNVWIPSLPDDDYFCNGTPMFVEVIKHVKKKNKPKNINYVNMMLNLLIPEDISKCGIGFNFKIMMIFLLFLLSIVIILLGYLFERK